MARFLIPLSSKERKGFDLLKSIFLSVLLSLAAASVFWLIDGCRSTALASELVRIQGRVSSLETGEPIAGVTVRVEGTGISTLANDEGRYQLLFQPGSYKIKFSHISYYSEWLEITVEDSLIMRDISMREAVTDLGTVRVYADAYDPAQQIIVEAIRRKSDILSRLHDFQYQAYTRFVLRDESVPDSSEILLIAESQTTAYWERPDKYKEIITARKHTANIENVFVAVGEFLNFNRNRIELGDYSIVSPTAHDALDHYDYYLMDTIVLDSRLAFRLELEPKNPSEPLFEGFIHIVDSTYDVVAVDLGLSKGVNFPLLSNLRYSQTFAQFEEQYWMPVEIRFGGDVDLDFPLPGIPSKLSFSDVASLYRFQFEQGHRAGRFDEYALEIAREADDVDSAAWNARQTVPLTTDEELAYRRIDSLESLPTPLGKRIATAALGGVFLMMGGADDIFHFNRVEGAYLGLGTRLREILPRTTVRLKSGYAFDGDYWQHDYGVDCLLSERRRLTVGVDYHDEVVRRETVMRGSNYSSTMLALTWRIDPHDYFLEKGFRFSASFRPFRWTRLTVSYRDYNHYSTPVNSVYGFFGSEEDVRPNPSIAEGKYRSLAVGILYDSRSMGRSKRGEFVLSATQYTVLKAGIEYASPDFIDNDFDFRRYYASLTRRQRLFSFGISSLFIYAGSSDRTLPPQRYYTIDHGAEIFTTSGGFSTLDRQSFSGNRVLAAFLTHDFDNRLFRRSGLPLIRQIPWHLSLHGGAFVIDIEDQAAQPGDIDVRTAPDAYSEIGFGLANLTPFLMPFNLAMQFRWQLSDYDTNRYQISLGFEL